MLINFANYDRIAKEIKNLPDEVGEDDDLDLDLKGVANQNGEGGKDGAQKKVKLAIFMRANLFLQQNVSHYANVVLCALKILTFFQLQLIANPLMLTHSCPIQSTLLFIRRCSLFKDYQSQGRKQVPLPVLKPLL